MAQGFDPSQYGATPVESAPPGGFDPAKYGATPVAPPVPEVPSGPSQLTADYVYTNNGYRINPLNKNAHPAGNISVFTKEGKITNINLDPKLPAQMAPGVIEGNLRSQQTLPSKIKSAVLNTPLAGIPGMGGVSLGNLAEGFAPAVPSLHSALRTGGAIAGATIGGGAGAAGGSVIPGPGTVAGAIGGAAAGGAAGASIGESVYQLGNYALHGNEKVPTTIGEVAKGQGSAIAEGAASGAAGQIANKLTTTAIPSTIRAGQNLDTVMGAAKNVPLSLTGGVGQAAVRAEELSAAGANMPKVLRDYIKFPSTATMTYETGRDFASNAGALSASEKLATNPQMGRQVALFAKAMGEANRDAAASVGMGDLYDSAMKEYAQAKTMQQMGAIAKKWMGRAAVTVALGGGAYKLGTELWGKK